MYKYEIGKQVICIAIDNGKPWLNYHKTAAYYGPKPGQILTIRDINSFKTGELGLRFHEFSIPIGEREAWFNANEFRPVRDTNIDELIKLANPVNEKKHIEVS